MCSSTNGLDAACIEQAKRISFASMMTISDGAVVSAKSCHSKGNGRKAAGLATASAGVGTQAYIPIKLPISREAQIKAMAVGLEVANAILPFPLCADPMLLLVATLDAFKVMLDSKYMVLKDK